MQISDRLAEIEQRTARATEGPWERGDHYHVQGASHCQCHPQYGPLVAEKRMDINGEMMLAHVHRSDEPYWPHGIYSPTDGGPMCVVYEEICDADAEFIAASRTDVPTLVAALRDVLDVCDRTEASIIPRGDFETGQKSVTLTIRATIANALGEGS